MLKSGKRKQVRYSPSPARSRFDFSAEGHLRLLPTPQIVYDACPMTFVNTCDYLVTNCADPMRRHQLLIAAPLSGKDYTWDFSPYVGPSMIENKHL